MEFETLKESHKKEILIGAVVFILITIVLIVRASFAKYQTTKNVTIAEGTVNYKVPDFKIMAMYKNDGAGDIEITTMPASGYAINESKSYCTLDNINKIYNKMYTDEDGNHVIANLSKSSKCYLYFDDYKKVNTPLGEITVKLATPDFSKTSCTSGCGESTVGIYEAKDDDGWSYYYRGDVENNYVRFAGYWWRIIRINGDGSIRMIHYGSTIDKVTYYANNKIYNSLTYSPTYLGFKNNKPGFGSNIVESSERNDSYNIMTTNYSSSYYSKGYNYDRETGKFTLDQSEGNMISGKWSDIHDQVLNERYLYTCDSSNISSTCQRIQKITGYTAPTETNLIHSKKYVYMNYVSTSYENAIKNIDESNALKELNTWYEGNIKDQQDSNGNLLSTYLADNIFCNDRELHTGDGFDAFNKTTYYKSYSRVNTKSPSLICTLDNDKFTVSKSNGNGALSNPIGLITSDEALLAGTYIGNYTNKLFYLSYGTRSFYTMSPQNYSYSNGAGIYIIASDGSLSNTYVHNSSMIRPVINLKANTKIVSGNGTPDSPFEITLG